VVYLLHEDEEIEDEDYVNMIKSLCYSSSHILRVRQLPSGYSRDIDGEVFLSLCPLLLLSFFLFFLSFFNSIPLTIDFNLQSFGYGSPRISKLPFQAQ